jgi:integrase
MRGLYRRGAVYWVRFSFLGKQHRISTGETDEARAIVAARQVLEDPGGWIQAEGSSALVELDLYLEMKRKRGVSVGWCDKLRLILAQFFREQDVSRVREISAVKVEAWLGRFDRASTEFSRWTVLNGFCKWLLENGRLSANPCLANPRRKVSANPRRRFLSPGECDRLFAACREMENPELLLAVQFGIYAGMRKNEILHIQPSWLDLDAGLIHISPVDDWLPKRGKLRTIPLAAKLRAAVELVGVRSPWVVAPEREAVPGKLYRWQFKNGFSAAVKRAGLENVVFHDLRRTFASLHVSAGTSIYKVAKWIGDEMESTERHYGHLSPVDADIDNAFE